MLLLPQGNCEISSNIDARFTNSEGLAVMIVTVTKCRCSINCKRKIIKHPNKVTQVQAIFFEKTTYFIQVQCRYYSANYSKRSTLMQPAAYKNLNQHKSTKNDYHWLCTAFQSTLWLQMVSDSVDFDCGWNNRLQSIALSPEYLWISKATVCSSSQFYVD